jgi:starch synthase
MTRVNKVLFITQEVVPFVEATEMSLACRQLPPAIYDKHREIRIFMPKWGNINERRNQLHEVIRLSGMNLIIDDTDHPLIIKVASLPGTRLQVYFIDNDDYFQNRLHDVDADGNEYADNDERAVFYARGVLETMKKLRWSPDIVHCHGWMASLAPLYLKTAYKDEPTFRNSKIVLSIHGKEFERRFRQNFTDLLLVKGVTKKELAPIAKKALNYVDLMKFAIHYSEGVVANSPDANEEVLAFAREQGKRVIDYNPDLQLFADACDQLYDEIWEAANQPRPAAPK